MEKKNRVFIATSLDGYIADENGNIDWLSSVPNPDQIDMGYQEFMASIDALVMGRTTFETVLGFGVDWPYDKPVYVLSSTMTAAPPGYDDKVVLVNGPLQEVLAIIHSNGHYVLYIDGGRTIQSFLREDLIDEMIISIIPTLLGRGIPLFSDLSDKLDFACIESRIYLNAIAQVHFARTSFDE